jgi:hypothetical protein
MFSAQEKQAIVNESRRARNTKRYDLRLKGYKLRERQIREREAEKSLFRYFPFFFGIERKSISVVDTEVCYRVRVREEEEREKERETEERKKKPR